jgi:hypothetical protein
MRRKKDITISELMGSMPIEYHDFLEYVRDLKFNERPDYEKWKCIFENLAMKLNINKDALNWGEDYPAEVGGYNL